MSSPSEPKRRKFPRSGSPRPHWGGAVEQYLNLLAEIFLRMPAGGNSFISVIFLWVPTAGAPDQGTRFSNDNPIRNRRLNFRVPRQNEAARAADAAAWVLSAVLIFGSQGGVPVPDLRKIMLEGLQRRHYSEVRHTITSAMSRGSHEK